MKKLRYFVDILSIYPKSMVTDMDEGVKPFYPDIGDLSRILSSKFLLNLDYNYISNAMQSYER